MEVALATGGEVTGPTARSGAEPGALPTTTPPSSAGRKETSESAVPDADLRTPYSQPLSTGRDDRIARSSAGEEIRDHNSVCKFSSPVRFGGRFWCLAEQDEELQGEHGKMRTEEPAAAEASAAPSPSTPAPSMEVLQECKLRHDPILARKKEPPPRKPWKGPIPKVVCNPVFLSDFIKLDCWIKKPKNKRPVPSVLRPSALFSDSERDSGAPGVESVHKFRDDFLNALTAVGPDARSTKIPMPGYMAQDLLATQDQADLDSVSSGYMAQDTPDHSRPILLITTGGVSEETSLVPCPTPSRTRVRRSNPGFPLLGPGRALRVPASASLSMAARGSKLAPFHRPSGQQVGQGNPSVEKPTATADAQPGKAAPATVSAQPANARVPAHAGRLPSGAADKDTHMTDGDDASGSKDNADGSNDTGPNSFPKQTSNTQQNQTTPGAGLGPTNSDLHKELRFGAFEPSSAPAKIGSRAGSNDSSLPRFLGKKPRTYIGSVQSKAALEPLSLEEYLVGAKASSTTLSSVQALTGAGSAYAGMEGSKADGLVSLDCQPLVDGMSQHMQMHADATNDSLGQEASLLTTEVAAPAGLLPLCTAEPAQQPAQGAVSEDGMHHDGAAQADGGEVFLSEAEIHQIHADQAHDNKAHEANMHVQVDVLDTKFAPTR
ncbi:hypothetical protein ZWY2020_004238 [Hordeum vulgare]|nr:hypothetical protein ZWY2020_004238 [Hordeum vulgare]